MHNVVYAVFRSTHCAAKYQVAEPNTVATSEKRIRME